MRACAHAAARMHSYTLTHVLPLSHARTHTHIHPFQQPCDGGMHVSFKKTHTSILGTVNVFKSESDNKSGQSLSSRLATSRWLACVRAYACTCGWIYIIMSIHTNVIEGFVLHAHDLCRMSSSMMLSFFLYAHALKWRFQTLFMTDSCLQIPRPNCSDLS